MTDKFPIAKGWAIASTVLPVILFMAFVATTPLPLFVLLLFGAALSFALFGFIRFCMAPHFWQMFNPKPTQPKFRMNGVYSDYRKCVSYQLETLSHMTFREGNSFHPRYGWEASYYSVADWQLSELCGANTTSTYDNYDEAMDFFQRFSDAYLKKIKSDQEAKNAVCEKTGEVASLNTETGELFTKFIK